MTAKGATIKVTSPPQAGAAFLVALAVLFAGTAMAAEANAREPKAAQPKAVEPKASPAKRPAPPVVRPLVAPPMGELPDTPETPAEKLPVQFFAATGQVCLQCAYPASLPCGHW